MKTSENELADKKDGQPAEVSVDVLGTGKKCYSEVPEVAFPPVGPTCSNAFPRYDCISDLEKYYVLSNRIPIEWVGYDPRNRFHGGGITPLCQVNDTAIHTRRKYTIMTPLWSLTEVCERPSPTVIFRAHGHCSTRDSSTSDSDNDTHSSMPELVHSDSDNDMPEHMVSDSKSDSCPHERMSKRRKVDERGL